jgi:hypothetical protein
MIDSDGGDGHDDDELQRGGRRQRSDRQKSLKNSTLAISDHSLSLVCQRTESEWTECMYHVSDNNLTHVINTGHVVFTRLTHLSAQSTNNNNNCPSHSSLRHPSININNAARSNTTKACQHCPSHPRYSARTHFRAITSISRGGFPAARAGAALAGCGGPSSLACDKGDSAGGRWWSGSVRGRGRGGHAG